MSAQVDPTAPGQRLVGARYALLDVLGRGGMGVVWRAEDRVIGRQVAVKELALPDGVSQHEREVFGQRVLREVRTAGILNDPAVVTVHDVVTDEDRSYIVMELVPAPSLSDVVAAQGPLAADQVIALAEQVLGALEAAHAAGIVHRDVKPSNIMVLPNGRVKLADFGIAQAIDDPTLTTSGMLVGSPSYLAPERVHGSAATPAADLWALGAVLYYAIEGRAAFERDSTAATLHAVLNEPPRLTRAPGPLAAVITGLLLADPRSRLTAPQVRALLRVPDTTVPMVAGPWAGAPGQHPTGVLAAGGSPTRPAARPRAGLFRVLGAVVVVLLVAGAALAGYQFGHANQSTTAVTPLAGTYSYGAADAQIPEFDLSSGQCGDGAVQPGRSFASNTAVDCASAHDFQVFGAVYAVESSSLRIQPPSRTDLTAEADSSCAIEFDSAWITLADKATALNYTALIPSPQAWQSNPDSQTGTRQIVCVLTRRDGEQLTGSVVSGTS